MNECTSSRWFFHVPPGGTPVALPTLEAALALAHQEGYLWLNFNNPERAELTALMEPLGLHPLAIDDCLDEDQIPKIEDYPTNTFILFNRFFYENITLAIEEIDLFLGKNFLIMVTHDERSALPLVEWLEKRMHKEAHEFGQGPDFLLHVIMDYIVDHKFHTITGLQEELDAMEEAILNEIDTFRPEDLMRLRRCLLSLRKSITHEREILVKICRRDSPFITEKAIYHYRDIYDHLAKFFEQTEMYREMISNFMDMYLSMMNNRMTMLANRTNQVVRRLTLITTIFMPLTLLSGIGGMSEWSMMTGPDNWRVAYPLFLGFMVIVGVVNYMILKKLESRDGRGRSSRGRCRDDARSEAFEEFPDGRQIFGRHGE